ncbi:hypothetical protein I0C86_40475 [Plantactinospora sp. S1510]|uniref:Uncharacterized protein n=1 Tax=Plantactinospora alkalitolerans TaxID=2789879 RepID=A0ABS0H9K6_9ACTN|nr:hypothetical protein [Plantactinospora alkalitolerans]MBF9135157.1 hypothetical protein [Plantactinospora alkalitolerans]
MGPYCQFCDQRCFLPRVLRDARLVLLATCAQGMERDRAKAGQDHTTALNPVTDRDAVAQLVTELTELETIARDVTTEGEPGAAREDQP